MPPPLHYQTHGTQPAWKWWDPVTVCENILTVSDKEREGDSFVSNAQPEPGRSAANHVAVHISRLVQVHGVQ